MLSGVYPTTLGVIPTHGLFVGLGVLAAAAVFVVEARRRGQTDERIVYVVLGALVGGAVFMRLGTWLQHVDLRENASLAEQWLYGNRSILGGLVGAWLGVHVAKRLVGYRVPDRRPVRARRGAGHGGRPGRLPAHRAPRHTHRDVVRHHAWTQAAAARLRRAGRACRCTRRSPTRSSSTSRRSCALWFWLRHRLTAPGETLTFYLAGYGIFRFLVEFVRGNEVAWAGPDPAPAVPARHRAAAAGAHRRGRPARVSTASTPVETA